MTPHISLPQALELEASTPSGPGERLPDVTYPPPRAAHPMSTEPTDEELEYIWDTTPRGEVDLNRSRRALYEAGRASRNAEVESWRAQAQKEYNLHHQTIERYQATRDDEAEARERGNRLARELAEAKAENERLRAQLKAALKLVTHWRECAHDLRADGHGGTAASDYEERADELEEKLTTPPASEKEPTR